MSEDKNELAKFIKKRLQETKEKKDNWDLPEKSVWEKAQLQMHAINKNGKRKAPFSLLWLFFGLLLLVSISYNAYLLRLNNESKEKLVLKDKVMIGLREELSEGIARQKIFEEKQTKISESLLTENINLKQQNELNTKSVKHIQQKYQALITAKIKLDEANLLVIDNAVTNVSQLIDERSTLLKKDVLEQPISLNKLVGSPIYLKTNLNANNGKLPLVSLLTDELSKKEKRFELGVKYGFSNIEMLSEFKLHEKKEFTKQINEVVTPVYHLYSAYALKDNWWLNTGLACTKYSYCHNYQFKYEYNKANEFVDDKGSKINEITLQTRNGNYLTEKTIEIDVQDNDLKTGDWVFGDFKEMQNVTSWQTSLGIEYRQRNKTIAWQFSANTLGTVLTFFDKEITGKIQSTHKEFPTKVVDKDLNTGTRKLVFGLQGGIGLNYQFYDKISLSANALMQYSPYYLSKDFLIGITYQL